jgi:hypothetical protein
MRGEKFMSRFKERLKKLEKPADKLMRLRGLGPYKCERGRI